MTERPPRRVLLRGVAFDAVTEGDVVERIMDASGAGAGGWVVTPNLHILERVERDPALRDMVAGAVLVVADGMPLIWASRLADTPLPARVAGSDLIWSLSAAAARAGLPIFLLGGEDGVAERAASVLRARHPGLAVGVHYPPPGFEDDPEALERLRAAIVGAQPAIVFVGLGFPKQERVIALVREELRSTWFLGVGISLSFVSGDVHRAPPWMQRGGLEWIHRLRQEPRRLGRRYVREGLPYSARLLASSAATRRRRIGRGQRA